MDVRKLMVVPMLGGALALGACGAEEEPVENVVVVEEPAPTLAPEPVTAEPVETEVEVEPAEGAAAEIPGNGIDDDLDGQIDEAI